MSSPILTNVIMIAAGDGPAGDRIGSALMLLENGRIFAYSPNRSSEDFRFPTRGDVQSISAGGGQDLELVAGGAVFGSRLQRWSPMPAVPASATNAVLIAAGTNCSLAVDVHGRLIAWGTSLLTNTPPSAANLIAVASAPTYCLGVTGDSTPPRILGPRPVAYRSRISVGDRLPLYVRAVGSQPLHYQWLTNGVPVPNTDSPLPQLTAMLGTDDVEYQVTVFNDFGSVISAPAKIAVSSLFAWGDNKRGQANWPLPLTNVTKLAAGAFHALALDNNGLVTAWGKNADGQTNVPSGLANVVDIAAGGDHSVALASDGSVVAWGRNWDGQTNVPAAATDVRAISAGWAHSLALRGDGGVVAWGNNDYGQTNVAFLPHDIVGVAAGYFHSAALRAGGTVVTWGWDIPVPATATNIVRIAAGWEHCLALRADATVVAWGDNSYGQSTVPPDATNVVSISAGYYHNLALRGDGSVIAWGKNVFGVAHVPSAVRNITSIAAGEDYSLAVLGLGPPRFLRQPQSIVAHVGVNAAFMTEVTGAYPRQFQWFHNAQPMSGATNRFLLLPTVLPNDAGTYSLLATNSFGSLPSSLATLQVDPGPEIETLASSRIVPLGGGFCLQAGVVGAGPLSFQWQLNGVNLTDGGPFAGTGSPVLCVSASQAAQTGAYSLILSNAYGAVTALVAQVSVSTILAWGDNSAGQLDVPATVTDVQGLSAGGQHNLLLQGGGTILAWGDNSYGQCDLPNSATNVIAVSAGEAHSLALRGDGTVLAWGDNTRGQTNLPVFAASVVSIAAGGYHNLALLNNGTVVAWGLNQTNVPPSATNIIAIAEGGNRSMALRSDGTVISWSGIWGSTTPPPNGATNIVAIAAGGLHLLALRADGALFAWGDNYYGQATVPVLPAYPRAISAGGDHNLALLGQTNVVAWGADYAGQIDVPDYATNVIAISAGGAHSLALLNSGVQTRPLVLEMLPASNTSISPLRVTGLSAQGAVLIQTSTNLIQWDSLYTSLPTLGHLEYLQNQLPGPYPLLPRLRDPIRAIEIKNTCCLACQRLYGVGLGNTAASGGRSCRLNCLSAFSSSEPVCCRSPEATMWT